MKKILRFAEAVCAGHPDRLADAIADRIVALAVSRDPDALVAIEVALNRAVVFVDGRIAAGTEPGGCVSEAEIDSIVRAVYRDAGYGQPEAGGFGPDPTCLEVRFDLCLDALEADERTFRSISDDQVIAVGYACRGERAGLVPLEQALARDFAGALERLRAQGLEGKVGPDGKVLVAIRGKRLVAVSLSIQHVEHIDWLSLVDAAKGGCLAVAAEYVGAGELEPPDATVSWLVNGAGAFSAGGPLADNGLSGKKLVAEAYGSAIPIGGGTVHGKDPKKPDVRAQRIAREKSVELVRSGAAEATVWVVFRPGDEEPAFVECETIPANSSMQEVAA
jgi:S-adenosylmethionine synthetase